MTDYNKLKIYAEWRRYWNVSKPVLLEKSPRHTHMMPMLQYWFSDERSIFVVLLKHPFSSDSFLLMKPRNFGLPANSSSFENCREKAVQSWLQGFERVFHDLTTITNHVVLHFERAFLADTNGSWFWRLMSSWYIILMSDDMNNLALKIAKNDVITWNILMLIVFFVVFLESQ